MGDHFQKNIGNWKLEQYWAKWLCVHISPIIKLSFYTKSGASKKIFRKISQLWSVVLSEIKHTKKIFWSLYFAFSLFSYFSLAFIRNALKLTRMSEENLNGVHFNYFSCIIKEYCIHCFQHFRLIFLKRSIPNKEGAWKLFKNLIEMGGWNKNVLGGTILQS